MSHAEQFYDYREFIRGAYLLRTRRNSKYSLRAYARDLGLSASTLNEILKGRYGLSSMRAQSVAQKLGLSSEEMDYFCALVALSRAKSSEERIGIQKQIQEMRKSSFVDLDSDQFRFVADWYHMAILELFYLKKFRPSVSAFSARLNIPSDVVTDGLERLQRIGLLKEVSGKLVVTEDFTAVAPKAPSSAVRQFHRQIIQKADRAVESQSIDSREISSTVFSIAKKDLPEAKRQLREWRQRFAQNLSAGSDKDDVYCLAIQFFSLLKNEDDL